MQLYCSKRGTCKGSHASMHPALHRALHPARAVRSGAPGPPHQARRQKQRKSHALKPHCYETAAPCMAARLCDSADISTPHAPAAIPHFNQ